MTKYPSLYACAGSVICICYYTCVPKKVLGSKKKKRIAVNLENPRSGVGSTWENAVEKCSYKVIVFLLVLLLDKKLKWTNFSFCTKKGVCTLELL